MASKFSLGDPFIELQQVESTNNYATGLVHAGMAQPGTAVFAHHQIKGKGQRHKQWYSEAFKNIALSVVLRPSGRFHLSQSFLFSMATAVATQRFFSALAGDETKIKWPNDIYWRDRKAGGILIENILQGSEWKWAVVGIGVNINQTDFSDVGIKATSLKQITGREHVPLESAKDLCKYLEKAYEDLYNSPDAIIADYKSVLFKHNEEVLFKKATRLFSGTVKDVTANGQLVVQTGVEETFEVGEVEWVL